LADSRNVDRQEYDTLGKERDQLLLDLAAIEERLAQSEERQDFAVKQAIEGCLPTTEEQAAAKRNVQDMTQRLKTAESTLDMANDSLNQLQKRFKDLEEEKRAHSAAMDTKIAEERMSMRQDVERLEQRLATTQSDLCTATDSLQQLQQQFVELEKGKEEQSVLMDTKNRTLHIEAEELRNKLAQQTSIVQIFQSQSQGLAQFSHALRNCFCLAQRNTSYLESVLRILVARNIKLNDRLMTLRGVYDTSKQNRRLYQNQVKATQLQLTELDSIYTVVKTKADAGEVTLEQTKTKLEEKQAELDGKQAELEGKQTELHKLRNRVPLSRLRAVQAELELAGNQINTLRVLRDTVLVRLFDSFEIEAPEFHEVLRATILETTYSHVADIETLAKAMSNRIDRLEARLEEECEVSKNLRARLQRSEDELAQSEAHLVATEDFCKELSDQYIKDVKYLDDYADHMDTHANWMEEQVTEIHAILKAKGY
jgi:chromosome segregation ATPase